MRLLQSDLQGHEVNLTEEGAEVRPHSMIRYGNDIQLTELAREITNLQTSLNAHLQDGRLHSVFLHAQTLHKKLDKLQERLNEIQLVP